MTISGHNIIIGQNKKIVNIKFLITVFNNDSK